LYEEGDEKSIRSLVAEIMTEFGEELSKSLDKDLFNIRHYYEDGAFWVMKENGLIVGTIGLSKVKGKNIGKFRRFYLKKEYRGKGVGQMMFGEMEKFAIKMGFSELWTSTSANHFAAINFLEKAGFSRWKEPLWMARRAHLFYVKKL
jgi:putative acetyltransferase